MAIRLSRTTTNQTTSENSPGTSGGFDVTGIEGKSYDLEKIAKGKSRTDSSSEILAAVTRKSSKKEGSIAVATEDNKILLNNADAQRYLFRNETSSDAYTPSVTLRRPIVIWEDGTLDDNTTERADGVYESIFALEENISTLQENYKILLQKVNDLENNKE